MRLEEAKNWRMYLKQIYTEYQELINKSEEQKMALENIKLFFES